MDGKDLEIVKLETKNGTFYVAAKTSELNALASGGRAPSWLRYSILPDSEGEPTHELQIPVDKIEFIVRELPQEGT